MSKYGEMMALLEFASKAKNEKTTRWSRRRSEDDDDPINVLIKAKRFADEWKKFQEDQEKVNKKEDKKVNGGWESMSFVQKVTVLTMTVPLATMGYGILILLFLRAGMEITGMK